jgi:transcriptional regulator with XRE-family HTH domain
MKKNGKTTTRAKAIKLATELAKLTNDEGVRLRALQISDRLSLPMSIILDKVPGASVAAKCSALGISRQAYYYWLRGMSRPNLVQSEKLSKLTGFDAEDIRGKTRLSPPRPTAPLRASRSR